MNYTFVDQVVELQKGNHIRSVKNITHTEDYLDEYYPRLSTVPNSVIVEAMASTAALLLFASTSFKRFSMLLMIEKAVFQQSVHSGNLMILDVTLLTLHDNAARLEATVRAEEQVAAQAILILGLFDIENLEDLQMKNFFMSIMSRTQTWLQHSLGCRELDVLCVCQNCEQ